MPSVGQYQEKPFKSVTQGGADLANIKDAEGKPKDDKKTKPMMRTLMRSLPL